MSSSALSQLGLYLMPESDRLTRANWGLFGPRMLRVLDAMELAEYARGTIFPPSQQSSPDPKLSPADDSSQKSGAASPVQPLTQQSIYNPDKVLSSFLPISLPPDIDSAPRSYASTDVEWVRNDKRARNNIILNVADPASFGIEDDTVASAAEIWARLRLAFEVQDPAVVQHMRSRITSSRIDPSTTSVTSHFETLRAFRDRANRAGAHLSEAEFWSLASQSFPLQGPFGTVIWTLMTCQSSVVAETVLLAAEERLVMEGIITRSDSTSPLLSGGIPPAAALMSQYTRPHCTHCNRLGHYAPDCYEDGGEAVSRRPDWWLKKRGLTTPSSSSSSYTSGNAKTSPSAALAMGGSIAF